MIDLKSRLPSILLVFFVFVIFILFIASQWISKEIEKTDLKPPALVDIPAQETSKKFKEVREIKASSFSSDPSLQESAAPASSHQGDKKIIYEIPLEDNILIQ